MSDLPSRDRMKPLAVSLRKGAVAPNGLVEEIIVTIEARASGRLVDREAIDRRAAQIAVAEGISDHISAADDWEEWAAEALALVDLCLVAALEQV